MVNQNKIPNPYYGCTVVVKDCRDKSRGQLSQATTFKKESESILSSITRGRGIRFFRMPKIFYYDFLMIIKNEVDDKYYQYIDQYRNEMYFESAFRRTPDVTLTIKYGRYNILDKLYNIYKSYFNDTNS
jgi:hypothetical protein